MSFPAAVTDAKQRLGKQTQRRGEELIYKSHPWLLSAFAGVNGFTHLKAFSLQPNPLSA